MAHDAFVSYSSKDKAIADAVCATLEANGIRCWIAPRDVLPGMNWAGSIVEAIHTSRVLVLVFSANSNTSTQVMNEIERAVNAGIPILPFRIEDIVPSDAMGYFLGSRHWLDALTPPMEQHLQQLTGTVRLILEQAERSSAAAPASAAPTAPRPAPPAFVFPASTPQPAAAAPRRGPGHSLRSPVIWAGLAAAAIAVALVAILADRRPSGAAGLGAVQLYNALLQTPLSRSALPAGYSSPQAPYAVTDGLAPGDRAAGALGQVRLDVTGPDWHDGTSFVVFASDADAHAAFDKFNGSITPNGISVPAKCGSGSATLDTLAYGYTRCAALSDNVTAVSESILLGDGQSQGRPSNAATLLRLGLTHLAAVRAHPPLPLSGAAPPQPQPSPSPLAQLPSAIKVSAEDSGAQPKSADADLALRTILAGFEAGLGVTESRPWTLHLYTDEAAARQELAKLGTAPAAIDSFFQDQGQAQNEYGSGAMDSVLFVPNLEDLRGELAYLAADYSLYNNGAFQKDDVYPWWFILGLEEYEQTQYSQTGYGYHAQAVSTAKSGLAPALGSIASSVAANQFAATQPQGALLMFVRGAAALDYVSQRHGEATLGQLLKGNALGSIEKFNGLLASATGQSVAQLNDALNLWLRGGTGTGVPASPTATATVQCPGWAGSWDTSFGPMQLSVSGSTLTGTYTYQGGQGRLNGTVAGNVISGIWAEAPTYQAPDHAGDFQFTLAPDARSFTGQWRYGTTGELHMDWTGSCAGPT